ncbi:MAG: sensor histidine kinase [Asticcacaulis sp.]
MIGAERLLHFVRGLINPKDSLAARLVRLALIWSLTALLLVGVGLTAFFHHAAMQRFQAGPAILAENLYALATVTPDGQVLVSPMGDARSNRVYSGLYWQVAVVDPDAKIIPLSRSRSLWDARIPVPVIVLEKFTETPGKTLFYDAVGPQGQPLRVAVMQGRLPDVDAPLLFMAAEDRSPVDQDAARFAILTAVALVLLGTGLVAAILVQVRVGLGPLFRIGQDVARVRQGKQQRLEGRYPVEIAPLAEELNALLDHNQEVVERQRTHVGNLAHALKTPLSVMLTEAGDDQNPLAAIVRKQSQVMKDQVDHHLRRARAAARSQSMGERTPVEPVVDELAVTLERVFQSKALTIDWRMDEDLAFRGERQDLQEIIGNLLENAAIWCRSRIRIKAEYSPNNSQFLLIIEDDGPGLPADRREEVLKRGARLDEKAPGSGLGLSIVDELVRAYGGKMQLLDSVIGGLKIELTLPAAEK